MVSFRERLHNYKRAIEKSSLRKKAHLLEKMNSIQTDFSTKDSILICGQPRGGTTWLAETIANHKKTGIIWEPLHPQVMVKFDKTKEINQRIGNFPYIPENMEDIELKKFFEELLTLKYVPYEYVSWTYKLNKNLLDKENWIFKFCRANRMLPWIVNNIDLKDPIYLLRHPCAVIASQLNHKAFETFQFDPNGENGLYNDQLIYDNNATKLIKSKAGQLAFWWCLDNFQNLNHPSNNVKWITITYEELVTDPINSFKHLYERLDIPYSKEIEGRLKIPSSTTQSESQILRNSGDQLSSWKSKLTKAEISEILSILEAFEINVYSDSIIPDLSKIPKN